VSVQQAARDAETILGLDLYRETAYLRLMLAHAAAGTGPAHCWSTSEAAPGSLMT
jgi:hypothetical protein